MPSITFLDQYVAQSWSALTMINKILSKNKIIKRIVELGTGSGALTLLFGLNMIVRGGHVLTFDIVNFSPELKELFPSYNIEFVEADVFQTETIEMVKGFSYGKPTLFFCDNGDKPREFRTYSQLMKRNDIIMVHDWRTEFTKRDLIREDTSRLEPHFQKELDIKKTHLLCMRQYK